MYNSPAAHLNRHYTTNKYTEYISSKSNSPRTLKRASSSELKQYDPDHTSNLNNSNCMTNVSKISSPSRLDSTMLSKKIKYSSRNSNSSDEINCKPQANWLRIVKFDAINSSSFESVSSAQFKRIVHKSHSKNDTDIIPNSLPQPIWHRTVKCVTSETSDKTVFPLTTEKTRHATGHVFYDQYSTPTDVFNSHGHQSHFSQVKVASQNELKSSTSVCDRSSDITHTSSCPTSSSLMENLPMSANTPISSHTEFNRIFNSTLDQPSESSNIVYSNHAQIIIDLDDFTSDELQPHINDIHYSRNFNPVNYESRSNMPLAQSISSSSVNTESETLEVVIRSRNNADFNVMINNPDIIRMHKILQRHLSIPSNLNMSTSNPNLFHHVNNYMQILRSTIFSTGQNDSNIMSILNTSIPQLLTFDQSSYTLIDKSSIMPPVNTVFRFQKGRAVTNLANCAICLEENVGNVLLKPCNHYDMCGRCMENLKKWICPICRSPISNIIVYV